jgi:hypothetical protein
MTRTHFILRYRLDQVDGYLIWYGDDVDGVVIDSETGQIVVFSNPSCLRNYAENLGMQLANEDLSLYNLDTIQSWLKTPTNKTVDCVSFLNTWNLFADVAASISDSNFDSDSFANGLKPYRQKTNKIYNKLFWGNNLPTVTSPSKHYEPIWTTKEVKILVEVLKYGLFMFRQAVQPIERGKHC